MRRELRRLMWRLANKPFIVVRGEALCLMCCTDAPGGEGDSGSECACR